MIGHRSRFRENDDSPLRRGPVAKKKSPFSNACAQPRPQGLILDDFHHFENRRGEGPGDEVVHARQSCVKLAQ